MKPGSKAILVVSFGTTFKETCTKTIEAVESQVAAAYPDWDVRRAFTSKMVIRKLAERDGVKIDHITDALERLVSEGKRTVVVQPTHVVNGVEHESTVRAVSECADKFDSISIGKPLLTANDDYDLAVGAIASTFIKEAHKKFGNQAAIVLMGHGTEHFANSSYCQLQMKLLLSGYPDVYVTTVEGFPNFEDTITLMKDKNYKDVVLFPFMLVAGDHAINDMAGDGEDSLKSVMEKHGYKAHCVLKGIGEYKEFRDLFLAHTEDAVRSL